MRTACVSAALILAGASAASAQYTAVILHPAGRASSSAAGARAGSQVGAAGTSAFTPTRAALWTGSAASYIDLHPASGYFRTFAAATDGPIQGGYGTLDAGASISHALIWRGSAATVIDLHPAGVPGYDISQVFGAGEGLQAGLITGSGAVFEHAALWAGSAVAFTDLHPTGYLSSRANAISRGEQAGEAQDQNFDNHAMVWRGTAASAVDLHPAGYSASRAFATDGAQQGGEGEGVFNMRFETHALLWAGTAASVIDLHPAGYDSSDVRGIAAGVQAGHIAGPATGFDDHAAVWLGSAATVLDLHQFLPPGTVDSQAFGVSTDGTIVGEAGTGTAIVAVLWVPVPPPCYANCDLSGAQPLLNVADFTCFLTKFAANDPYVNCDGSTTIPALNVADFTCFLSRFAAGCP